MKKKSVRQSRNVLYLLFVYFCLLGYSWDVVLHFVQEEIPVCFYPKYLLDFWKCYTWLNRVFFVRLINY